MCVHSCVSAHHHRFVYECAVTRIHIANALNKMYFVAKVHTYVNIFKTEGFFFILVSQYVNVDTEARD